MTVGVTVGMKVGMTPVVGMRVGASVEHWHDWISARSAPSSRSRSPI